MSIFRPPGGFNITITPACDALIQARITSDPGAARAWELMLERLKFVAHREGRDETKYGAGCRSLASLPDASLGWPRIIVICKPLGDTVTIKAVYIAPSPTAP